MALAVGGEGKATIVKAIFWVMKMKIELFFECVKNT